MKQFAAITILALGGLASTTLSAEQLVREFNGDKSETTPEFTVEGPWLLDWRLNGSYDQMMALDIALIDAKSGKHLGRVLHTQRRGDGLKIFDDGGTFKLRISASLARWTIKIKQIEEEEKERYTPRKDNPPISGT
jgi:hypothetical protein